jgi:hypothetical protein
VRKDQVGRGGNVLPPLGVLKDHGPGKPRGRMAFALRVRATVDLQHSGSFLTRHITKQKDMVTKRLDFLNWMLYNGIVSKKRSFVKEDVSKWEN